jgi:DNA primase
MAGFSPTLLDEIRSGVDIVELVGRFVNLRKAGQNWKGLCPFHSEKTPSFMVNPRKGIFHCFGCGAGGDGFGFLMKVDRLSFPEAVRALARQAGVALPDERSAGDPGRDALFQAMDLAARFYAEQLWKPAGEHARAYLARRGIEPDIARRFGLGWAPEGWDGLLAMMRGASVATETLETVGLVVRRESGSGHYDRFRGRLMFAIRDLQGRVVAFGGRGLGDEQPKYLNSPETPLYTKGNLLYAADLARTTIRERNRALLVEGYVDCLMAHQHGFTETVAALGTAFTPAQLAVLRRSCEEVVTFFDADAAGQKAAERAAELLEPTSTGAAWAVNRSGAFEGGAAFRLKVALLPTGHDPDTFLREHGAAAFAERIRAARSLLGYALDRAIADPDDATGPRARANAFARVALMLARVADAEEAAQLSREAAAKLGVDPTQLWIEAQKLQAALLRPSSPTPARPQAAAAGGRAEDRALVRLLLHHPAARPVLLPLLDDRDIAAESLRAVIVALRGRPEASGESLLTDLPDAARSLLAALLVEEDTAGEDDPAAAIGDFRRRLERNQRLRRIREVTRRIAEAPDDEGLPVDQLRLLHREGQQARATTLGVASAAPPGTPMSPRSSEE